MAEKKKAAAEEPQESTYTKEQILASSRYTGSLDLVGVLLEKDKPYTLGKVDELIADFKGREVK